MANKKGKKIELANCNSIRFPVVDKVEHDMFIIGNFDGIFGTFVQTPTGKPDFNLGAGDALKINGGAVIKTIQSKKHVYLLSTEETVKYFIDFLTICRDKGFFNSVGRTAAIKKYFHYSIIDLNKDDKEIIDCVNNKLFKNLNNMKFDNVIQNPPYNGSLHLDFLEKGLDLLTEKGRMVIIEPSTFFIDLRKWGKRGTLGRTNSDDILKYDKVKNALRGHVVCASLDNINKSFGTSLQFPFVTTVIDMAKTYDEFTFTCFGEKRVVKDLYDCNLIGDYNTVWSIFDKVLGHGDMLKNHITDQDMGQGVCYTKYIQMNPYVGCIINDGKHDRKSIEKYGYVKNNFGEYLKSYFSGGYFKNMFSENDANQIYDSIPKKLANGATYARPKYSDKNCECVYGTKEELANWEYNLFNTKLMIFICLALTIDQNNHLKDFLPFLVKKKVHRRRNQQDVWIH